MPPLPSAITVRVHALGLLLAAGPVLAAELAFGELPAGAVSTNVTCDVAAELCRDHLFDPALVGVRLPDGVRLVQADEYAKSDPGVADLLKRHSRFARYAVGSLCAMSVGHFVVDGVRVHAPGPTPAAFWWARAEGARDPRMRGKAEWVQLASWYSKSVTDRARIVATDPMAQFIDLEVTPTQPNVWLIRLALPTERIDAEVRGSGQRQRRGASEPAFMSVPFAGVGAGSFWVITYVGHHHQQAVGQWSAQGAGVFRDAFQIPGEAEVFGTVMQDGWAALSGLYRPAP
ncbi:MAG: hypothetical protein U1E77_02505 [Inhella sp.]